MNINMKSVCGTEIKIGDTVTIPIILFEYGNTEDWFGSEPQNSSYVELYSIQDFTGKVVFDEDYAAIVVSDGNRRFPISSKLRHFIFSDLFSEVDEEDIKEYFEHLNLEPTFFNFLAQISIK